MCRGFSHVANDTPLVHMFQRIVGNERTYTESIVSSKKQIKMESDVRRDFLIDGCPTFSILTT